jgi:pyrimidine operon attenuation protein/uracil phosphoribosyltransferase
MNNKGRMKARIMDAVAIDRTLHRIAHQILERNPKLQDVALIGIRRRGVPLAQRLGAILKSMEGVSVPIGVLDITLYHDDLTQIAPRPVLNGTDIPFHIENCTVILVDDVLFTGRTVLSALEALYHTGHPRTVQLAVLIDRGHRILPIHADYAGKTVPTMDNEIVHVMLKEIDNDEQVLLGEKEA